MSPEWRFSATACFFIRLSSSESSDDSHPSGLVEPQDGSVTITKVRHQALGDHHRLVDEALSEPAWSAMSRRSLARVPSYARTRMVTTTDPASQLVIQSTWTKGAPRPPDTAALSTS